MKNVTYINAGAGSGKTYTLTKELVKLIKSGVSPEKVILTTFTTKAAGEFKEKAKAELYANGMYDAALRLDQALIGTIHSVCQRMIGKYWFNLGLSPDMSVMAEEDVKYYLSQSLAELPTDDELQFLHEFCRSFDIREIVDFKPLGLDYDFWQGHLKQIIEFTTSYEIDNYSRSVEESQAFIRQFVDESCSIEITDSQIAEMLSEARTYVNNSNRIKKKEEYFKKFEEVDRGSDERNIAWYMLVAKNLDAKYGPTCQAVLSRLGDIWKSKEVYDLQEKYINMMFDLAGRWRDNFAQFKKEKNLLDFNDMEKYMRQLMQNREIASDIAKSFNYLFVDEFQDSSPIQVKIFDALSDLMEHSYWVGDYKQAVYRFRGSDIELVKAVVDRISTCSDGCDTRTLDTSYRSLPDIVEVNNEVFTQTFSKVLDYDNIHLKQHRENKENEDSLRFFCADGPQDVAVHVAKLLAGGAKPNEIAVLARANATLGNIAIELKEMHIPSSREDQSVEGTLTSLLVTSLLRITNSSKDTLAKATVATLVEKDYTTKRIIEEKLSNDKDGGNADSFLSEIPIISRLMSVRPKLQQQSISSMVESLIIELNLYNVVKRFEESAFAASCLQTIIATACTYEEHSIQMNLPATIEGFIAYLEEVAPKAPGDANGVQLHTYHSCKGLQWKYVILTSLNAHPGNIKNAARSEMYGVHFDHSDLPSADNPYPEVFIRLSPWIFGSAKNLPSEIEQKVIESEAFCHAYDAAVAEANRVLYVGMTRARDVLLLNIEEPKRGSSLLQWFKDVGLEQAGIAVDDADGWDILGTGHKFRDFTITDEEAGKMPEFSNIDETDYMELPLSGLHEVHSGPKYISPSSNRKKGIVVDSHSFEARIPFGKHPEDMSKVGDCIHQIFAGIEESRPAYKIEINEIIKSYGLDGVLIEHKAITEAWKNLVDWLTEKFGPAIHTWHERPFRMQRDGQTVVGSIDFVWGTEAGLYLIDFKTCPMGEKAILDEDSDHYAGWYAGQLNEYSNALELAGQKVLKKFIYYPVSGIIAEIETGIDIQYKESVFHIFGIADDIDLNQLCEDAGKYCSDDGFSGMIKILDKDDDDRENSDSDSQTCTAVLLGASTQGVELTYFNQENSHLHIDLPWLGSIGDVKLAFALMHQLREQYPDSEIYYNDQIGEGQFALIEENFDAMVVMRLRNMATLIEASTGGAHTGAPGFNFDFIVPFIEDNPDKDINDLTMEAMNTFIGLQWNYNDIFRASKANVKTPEGEEYVMRFLTNSEDTFVGVCEHIGMCKNEDEVKDILIKDFLDVMADSPYLEMVDAMQFVLKKMPREDWDKLYNNVKGEIIGEKEKHRTYILRWNPAISSFKMDYYRDAIEKYPSGWHMDWSIYDYGQAKENDKFYMMRVGDDKAGVIFRGFFSANPYEGDDWAGTDKKRYYVDIECFDPSDPDGPAHITEEELLAAIPEIEWGHGHSGELLTDEQAARLDALWDSKFSPDDAPDNDEDYDEDSDEFDA